MPLCPRCVWIYHFNLDFNAVLELRTERLAYLCVSTTVSLIIAHYRAAPYDVRECGRCGTEPQPKPLFNDGLLQPEQRVLDPGERTGARGATSLQHVHQEPALERLQSL